MMNLSKATMRPILHVFLVLFLSAGLLALQTHSGTIAPSSFEGKGTVSIDKNRPWTLKWVKMGIPGALKNQGQGRWTPWIAVNPENIRQTWWVWPVPVHNTMYFGRGFGSFIRWQPVKITSSEGLPVPWQEMMVWTQNFVKRRQPPPVAISPSLKAWDMGKANEQVAGFMMAMQSRPNTLALGVLLRVPGQGWIQLVGLWQWQHQWIAHYLIINPQPAILNRANLLMPPGQGLPLPLPSWAI